MNGIINEYAFYLDSERTKRKIKTCTHYRFIHLNVNKKNISDLRLDIKTKLNNLAHLVTK